MSVGKKLALVGFVAAGLYTLNKRRKGSRAVTAAPPAVVSLIEESKPRKPVRNKRGKRARAGQAKRARTV